jgi:hypothetical protein
MAGILAALSTGEGDPAHFPLTACASVLGLDGLAASLTSGQGSAELIAHSGPLTAPLEDLQYTLGLGPSADAVGLGAPVLVADLAEAGVAQWPGLPSSAQELGVRAVFAFPLQIGAIRVGALTGHRTRPGPLSGQSLVDALALADRLTLPLLAWVGEATDPAGLQQIQGHDLHHAKLHQATGMVSFELGITPADALLRLRAHAFRHRLPLLHVARAVVARDLHLSAHPDDADGGTTWPAPGDPDRA